MKAPVHIQTKKGLEFYFNIVSQYEWCKKWNLTDWFKQYTMIENANREKRLIDWSDEANFDYEEVFDKWKEEADCVAILSYYSKRM